MNLTKRSIQFNKIVFVVDRLHIKGQVGRCLNIFYPALYSQLDGKNTVICEHCNYWLGKYKFITKHMNYLRYPFFLVIICSLWNKVKLEKKIKLSDCFQVNKSKSTKRRYHDKKSISKKPKI